jgi:hypothetical protein
MLVISPTLLFPQKIKKNENSPTKDGTWSKRKGTYTNWFHTHLWSSIVVMIKKHGYNSRALHFLKQHLGTPTC